MSRFMNVLAGAVRRPFSTPFARKCVLASAALAALGGPAALPASAGERDHRDGYDRRDRDYRGHRDDYRDRKHLDVDFNLRVGGAQRRHEPVYEERRVRVWIPPVYRTVLEKRWVEPVYETVTEKVWVPEEYEVRQVRRYDPRHGWGSHEERVLVRPGRYDIVERRVCVREGYFENLERQVLVSEGHWEWKTERVQVGTREVHVPFGGLALQLRK